MNAAQNRFKQVQVPSGGQCRRLAANVGAT
jgi:hypothetical protein